MEDFGITEEDLLEINRSKNKDTKILPNRQIKIDYKPYLKEYFAFEDPKKPYDIDECDNVCGHWRRQYKDHLLLGTESKVVEAQKAINRTQVAYGPGREEDSTVDRIVLTRKVNHPELVFNQRIKYDKTFS